jgi:hypothetical protein
MPWDNGDIRIASCSSYPYRRKDAASEHNRQGIVMPLMVYGGLCKIAHVVNGVVGKTRSVPATTPLIKLLPYCIHGSSAGRLVLLSCQQSAGRLGEVQ